MKIIIIGAGISGLSTYLFFKKHLPEEFRHSIYIYEKRSEILAQSDSKYLDLEGGGLGIMPNGLQVLKDLDTWLSKEVASQGILCENFTFYNKYGQMGVRQNISTGTRELQCVSISRHGLWRCLMSQVKHFGDAEEIIKIRKVTRVYWNERMKKAVLQFTCNENIKEEIDAELVVGADGINSVTRRSLFVSEDYSPKYSGFSWVGGGIQPSQLPEPVVKGRAWVFNLDRQSYFCYSPGGKISGNKIMWLSLYADRNPSSTKLLKADLWYRHRHWTDPIIQDIITEADPKSINRINVMPELPEWGRNGIVLVGDAAHAMSPTSGQGASQGLEDAQALALVLTETLKQCQEEDDGALNLEIANAIRLFSEIRRPRVKWIAKLGQRLDTLVLPYSRIILCVLHYLPFISKSIRIVNGLEAKMAQKSLATDI
ncbi:FAD/NAD(P)-binding domain-containing protein [Zopfia rhizophila CBS 207.26]|uniref:FAD/NAD(P)-binding domain-containing protein n=1 Tax=Zopfia rhizophila CBS 207.26 TaxID=1314779 RepID=A0A6A6DSU6_9PEZI|nr:FAD/NAD(P)-binding domain-containing protein [Zopfia rhizophila CBS 207.26]